VVVRQDDENRRPLRGGGVKKKLSGKSKSRVCEANISRGQFESADKNRRREQVGDTAENMSARERRKDADKSA